MSKFSKVLKFCRKAIKNSCEDMAKNLDISVEDYIFIEEGKKLAPIDVFIELDKHFNFKQFDLKKDILADLDLYDIVRAEFYKELDNER